MVATISAPQRASSEVQAHDDRHPGDQPKPIFADRYRLDRMLEQADQAAVFSATDLRLRRTVSIKVVDPARAPDRGEPSDGTGQARPRSDSKQVQVLDAGITPQGTPFVVTEPAAPLNVLRVALPQSDRARRDGVGTRDREPDGGRPIQTSQQPTWARWSALARSAVSNHWLDRSLFVLVPLVAIAIALVQAVEVAGPILRAGPSLSSLVAAPTVPDLVGMPIEEARKLAEAKGLELRVMGRRPTDRFPSDVVAQQAPIPGWRLEVGEPLRVTVSAGVAVPDVRGASLDDARKTTDGLGWTIARIERAGGSDVAPGTVYMQHPAPGQVAPRPGELSVVLAD